ncbi:concanavalin A-like lectin/glucanase domain-containing protein [Lentinula guzmanii]|uniref:Concanavalin A-like lectin/glucanase domain-containing protein n=1 Tax=Lentinula guzmanii TaxID=2804957 RepID=A0AA38J523_9AGAR|nr:concanavalin A-like lectin/glucanase domain-containing protein [Lentinula guzmanii]
MIFVGVVISAVKCFLDYRNVPMITGNLCMVLDEGFNSEDGVFGDNGTNGEFEMTTDSENNSFVANVTSTFPDDVLQHYQGLSYTDSSSNTCHKLNETAIGSNTLTLKLTISVFCGQQCYRGNNHQPVQSARLSTRKTASMKFGRVDVVAKIPTGDWLPQCANVACDLDATVDDAYGAWPLSGEIDIMEAREEPIMSAVVKLGPLTWLNEVWRTYGWWQMKRGSFDKGFHTYSLEWTEKFMYLPLYVDSRLHHMLELNINEAFWDREWSEVVALQDPWINGTKAAPFDQRFYLILDVGVGGTNGWFPDGPEKPWLDGSLNTEPSGYARFLGSSGSMVPNWPTNQTNVLL